MAVAIADQEEQAVLDVQEPGAQPPRRPGVADGEGGGKGRGVRFAPARQGADELRVVAVQLAHRHEQAALVGQDDGPGVEVRERARALQEGELLAHGRGEHAPARSSVGRRSCQAPLGSVAFEQLERRAGHAVARPGRSARAGTRASRPRGRTRRASRAGAAARPRPPRPAPRPAALPRPPRTLCSSSVTTAPRRAAACTSVAASNGLTVPKCSDGRRRRRRRRAHRRRRAPRQDRPGRGEGHVGAVAQRGARGRRRTTRPRAGGSARRSCPGAGRPARRSPRRRGWPAATSAGSPGASTVMPGRPRIEREVLDRVVRRAEVAVGDAAADARPASRWPAPSRRRRGSGRAAREVMNGAIE